MKLTIIAATGGVGRHVLGQALAAGHDVTSVVRNPAKLSTDQAGRVVIVDMANPRQGALEDAIVGSGAVLSCLGPGANLDTRVTSLGTRAVVAAMRATGVRRVVAISSTTTSTRPSPGRPDPPRHDPGKGPLMRYIGDPIAKGMFGKLLDDLARMEDELRDSGLDWTILRPPWLNNKPPSHRYRTAVGHNVRGGITVPRADVADCMLAVLDRPDTIRQAVGVAT